MDEGPLLSTERLLLRPWRDEDLAPFADLNADPKVMEYFRSTFTREESDETAARIREHMATHGFGLWAVEVPGEVPFAGFVGLQIPRFEAPFMPCVEVGWRLAAAWHGRGYATEAARAALDHGFDTVGLEEVVSFTVPTNAASRRVMAKLGMTRDPAADFEHPMMEEGSPLRAHVLYRLLRDDWRARR